MDKYLIEFCKIHDISLDEVNDKYIIKIEESFIFQHFKLAMLIKEIILEIEKDIVRMIFMIKKVINKSR